MCLITIPLTCDGKERLFAYYVSGFSVVSPNLQSCNANQG